MVLKKILIKLNLLTKIPLKKEENQINYKSNLLLIGSCFSENIGKKLNYFKFNLLVNPFGILFTPKAIEQFISYAVQQKEFTEDDIFYHNKHWHSFDAHSNLSHSDKNGLLENLNNGVKLANQQLHNATHIIITLGTSWVYRYLKNNKIVANCHKVPQKEFSKDILSVNEIFESLTQINRLIHSVNKDVTIIYTISPVRHIKDGFIENQRSKSHLISAIHQVLSENVHYFPSYEIVMDELRDYRFYTEDMIHPNTTAINYIWERFCEVWLSPSETHIHKEIDTIQKGLNHLPFNQNSKEHKAFLEKLQNRILQITSKYPFMKF